MAQHYANNKVFTSARIKQKVMLSILLAAQRVSFKLSWDDFRQNLPSVDDVVGSFAIQSGILQHLRSPQVSHRQEAMTLRFLQVVPPATPAAARSRVPLCGFSSHYEA